MAKQNYVFYEKTSPFPGWIRMVGHIDPDQAPDGSTLAERLEQLKIKYPDADYKLFPPGVLPDSKAVKFDIATETLMPFEPGDITPKAQEKLDQAQKEQDFINNLPSWAQVETVVDNIANLADAKAFIKKLSRITYWLARNKKD